MKASSAERERGNIYNAIIRILLCATVVILPLFYLPITSGILEYNKQMLLVAVASFGLVLWLLGVVVSGKLTVRTTVLDKGVLAFLVATIVAAILSVTRMKSIFGLAGNVSSSLLTVITLTVFYFLAVNVFHDRGRMVRRALSLSVTIALVLSLLQMFALYILPAGVTHSRAFNTVGLLNSIGVVAAVCLVFFTKTLSRRTDLFDRVVAGIGLGAAIVVLGILNWWTLWVIAIVGMLAMTAFDSLNATQLAQDYGGSRRSRFALSRFVVPMIVVVLAAFFLLVNITITPLQKNFPVEVSPSYSLSWQVAKNAISEKVLYGYGPENFSLAFDRFGSKAVADSQWMNTKFFAGFSQIFSAATEGGALLLLAFISLFCCLAEVIVRFSGAIGKAATRGEGADFVVQASGTLAAVIAMAVALFLYPFNITLFFVWYVLLVLAALAVTDEKPRSLNVEERPMYSLMASLGFVVGLILVLTGAYFSVTRYWGNIEYAQAATAATPQDAATKIGRALDFDPNNDQYLRDASQQELTLLRQEIAAPAKAGDTQRSVRIQDMISGAVQLAQQATQVAPLEELNWDNLGQVYGALSGTVNNVEQLAQDAFGRASSLRPGDPTFDNEAGTLWLARADQIQKAPTGTLLADALSHAETAFKAALDKSSDYGLAIYNLGAVYDRQEKVTDAIKQLEKLVPYNANDSTLIFQLGLLYIRANQPDNAIAAMQRVVLLSPQYGNAHWYLGLLYENKGDIPSALAEYKAIQPDNQDNQILTDKINQLEAGQRSTPPAQVIDSKPLK